MWDFYFDLQRQSMIPNGLSSEGARTLLSVFPSPRPPDPGFAAGPPLFKNDFMQVWTKKFK